MRAAELLTAVAAGYVVNARTLDSSRKLVGQLQQALDSRVLLEQARREAVG